MAQMNKMKLPNSGSVRHIVGFGQGDPGYDVLETTTQDNIPCAAYYYVKNGIKHSVSVAKFQGRYSVEYETYDSPDSLISRQKKGCSLSSVTNDFLKETVMAYRAYRMLFNEYTSFRDDIKDALNNLQCVYLGAMGKDPERLKDILERSGFHVDSINFNMVKTKEKICISFDGLCFNEDEIIP
jgi:hypothetical protein